MLKFWTAVYRYSGADRFDITVKGNTHFGRAFAPTWDLVMKFKDGTINEEQYEREYRLLMLDSWKKNQHVWQELLAREEATIVCFCHPGAFCHRLLLAGYLEKVGAIHLGERNLFKGYPVADKQMSLLDVKHGIICQQVNCRGVMGAGIAKAIRDKWPIVYDVYREHFRTDGLRLGKIHLVPIPDQDLIVANLCGQNYYGRDKRYTDYIGLRKALAKLAKFRVLHHEMTGNLLPVYFPYKIGCNLGGGCWYLVHNMIKNVLPDAVIVRHS